MRVLLDTHVALWAIVDSPKLPTAARNLIAHEDNQIYFSSATVWEIAIKRSLARSDMPIAGSEALALFTAASYIELPITAAHAAAVERLPLLHADPFDRILVAQAITEPMRLLTHDRQLVGYGDMIFHV